MAEPLRNQLQTRITTVVVSLLLAGAACVAAPALPDKGAAAPHTPRRDQMPRENLTPAQKEARELWHKGWQLSKNGNYREAVHFFNMALARNPDWYWAYYDRARARANLGDYDKAIDDFNNCIKHDAALDNGYIGRAEIYMLKGLTDKAIDDYTVALERHPDGWRYECRARAYDSSHQYQKAINDWGEFLKRVPEGRRAGGYASRAADFEHLGKTDAALKDYSESIRLRPEEADTYRLRGDLFARLKRYDKAIADYTKSIQTSREEYSWLTYQQRAKAYEALGRHELAESDEHTAEQIRNK